MRIKRLFTLLLISGFVFKLAFGAPTSSMSITPTATSGATITAADENSRNTAISTPYNAHDHQDFTLTTSNSLTLGDGLSGDKNLLFNDDGASSPGFRWDDSLGYMVVSDDGTNWSSHSLYSGTVLVTTTQTVEGRKLFSGTVGLESAVQTAGSYGTSGYYLQTRGSTNTPIWAEGTKVKVATVSLNQATTGDTAITGVGFTPKAAIVLAAESTSKEMSLGIVSGTATTAAGLLSDGNNITAGAWYAGDTYIMQQIQSTDDKALAVLKSFDADGGTITQSKTGSPTGTSTVYIMFLGA